MRFSNPIGYGRFVVRGAGLGLLLLVAHWTLAPGLIVPRDAAAEEKGAKALANLPDDFEPYRQKIPETKLSFDMVPIPGGTFLMGSPEDEEGRLDDEGPPVEVKIAPFWMGTHEVTWDIYDVFSFSYDVKAAKTAKRKGRPLKRTDGDVKADAITRPTPPYVDMTFGYGHDGYPAICMTHHSATVYCQWLSTKTGVEYRLPTEAEWEYACRAGAKTPYFFGSDASKLGDYAWYFENANEKPQPVGKKKPSPWGLYDIHGNVSEWCQDFYADDYFERIAKGGEVVDRPVIRDEELEWHAVRGGSFEDDPELSRSATRRGADEDWSIQDPQIPKSIWYHTDAHFAGLRVVRSYDPKSQGE